MNPHGWMWIAMALLSACKTSDTGDTALPLEGPTLVHALPGGTWIEGDGVPLEVEAEDPDGVAGVRLYWRASDETNWSWDAMSAAGDLWSYELEGEPPALEYYFKGTDEGDPAAVSYLPEEATLDPFVLEVLVDAASLPFEEDFEPEGSEDELSDMGWLAYEAEFGGYPWNLAEGTGVDGSHGARHAIGNGDEDDLMEDWLISPALDLSGEDRAQVSWWEGGTGVELADHALYLSTGSRDPSDGDYVEVAALSAPVEEEGELSDIVDLAAWAGEPVVYLAWVYTGADADSWWIDEVSVEAFHAELSASLTWDPDPVYPGETVDLLVEVTNEADEESDEVTLTLTADADEGTFEGGSTSATATVGPIAGGGSESATLPFTVDSSVPENSYVTLDLEMTDGTWTWTASPVLTVGRASTASVGLSLDEEALLDVTLGVGDPDEPTWEETLFSGTAEAGSSTWEMDVTDLYDLLPPEAGALRWFARITPYAGGLVEGFELEYGGDRYAAEVLPLLTEGESAVVYLPEPPAPVLDSQDTDPGTVAPGDTGVTFTQLAIQNEGAAFQGDVVATLTSDEEHVEILSDTTVIPADASWEYGEIRDPAPAFRFDVSEEHRDSTDLAFTLTLTDDAESFEVPLDVEVPWPVFKITAVSVEDEEGDDDGVLDPEETAELEIDITNVGGLDSDGIVRGTLSVLSTSTASATVATGDSSFGSLSAGSTRDEEFEISVTEGSDGDALDLQLDLYDSSRTYQVETEIILGEPVWISVSAVDDAVGDMGSDGSFDFVNGAWRVWDERLELRCEAAESIDSETVFIEAWGQSSGAGYTYYRLVLQAGKATLQGYSSSSADFTDLAEPEITVPSESEVQFAWDLEVMDLATDSFSIGFGAGWCGPPDYYCDHFPDDWGYPYDSFSAGDWFDLSW